MSLLLPLAAAAADVDLLGPQTSGTGGASAETLNILQPANPQTLQSPPTNDPGLSQAPTGQNLQAAPGDQSQVRSLLDAEADSTPVEPKSDNVSQFNWLILLLVGSLAGLSLGVWWLDYTARRT